MALSDQRSLISARPLRAPGSEPVGCEDHRSALLSITDHCRQELLEHILPFWDTRVVDPDYPGLLHYFDRCGQLTCDTKSTWCQGRMCYTFALLAMELRDDLGGATAKWAAAAASAREFLVSAAYAGGGRWCYLCDRRGLVVEGSRSAFSDLFALMGLCTYAAATNSSEDHAIIRETVDALARNLRDPEFDEYHHFTLSSAYRWHAPAMALMGAVPLVRAVLGDGAVRGLADWALDAILYRFANDQHEMLFEMTDRHGRPVQTDQGQTTNPGHALESMWFCLEEALYRQDAATIARCLQVIRWAFDKGWDREHGGLFAFVDPQGNPPPGHEVVAFDDRWDDKLWWVHSEALYCLALAASVTSDGFYLQSLQKLHQWTFEHLPDRECGEWYLSVGREGGIRKDTKGNVFRSAFHVPRALLKVARLGDALRAAGTSAP